MASPRSPGKTPKPRARDSPSPTDGGVGRAVLATRRRVRPAARESWAALRAESAGARGADSSMMKREELGVPVTAPQPRKIRIDVIRVVVWLVVGGRAVVALVR